MALSVPKFAIYEGTPVYLQVETTTTPGVEQTLITSTVPAATTRTLHRLSICCRMESSYKVFADGQIIASGRTGAAVPNSDFAFTPPRALDEGTVLEVVFQSRSGAPAVDVEAYLQATDLG